MARLAGRHLSAWQSNGVGGSLHDPSALAAFQQGETRLVFARRKDGPRAELFYLEDGQAEALRKFTADNLECFMPECGNRRLTTVARRKGRDGFKHMRGAGGHADESLFHAQAKELVRRWAIGNDPLAEVEVEQATESKSRRADVMIRWSSDSLPLTAVEVQYSGLTVSNWQERHDSYVAQGIVDLWLFGHTGVHFKPVTVCGGIVSNHAELRLNAVHQAVLEANLPLIWINPIAALVAVASVPVRNYPCPRPNCNHPLSPNARFVPPTAGEARVWLSIDSLHDCSPTSTGLSTPAMERFRKELAALEVEADAYHQVCERQEAEKRSREEEDRRLADWHERSREDLRARWERSKLYRQILDEHGGTFPSELIVYEPSQDAVYEFPDSWHSLIYAEHIMHRQPHHRFTVADCYSTLARGRVALHHDPTRSSMAIVTFLIELERRGLVSIRKNGSWIGHIAVARTIKVKRAADAQMAKLRAQQAREDEQRRTQAIARREEEARRAQAEALHRYEHVTASGGRVAEARDGWVAEGGTGRRIVSQSPTVNGERSQPVGNHRCKRCHLPLDPILAEVGYHICCR